MESSGISLCTVFNVKIAKNESFNVIRERFCFRRGKRETLSLNLDLILDLGKMGKNLTHQHDSISDEGLDLEENVFDVVADATIDNSTKSAKTQKGFRSFLSSSQSKFNHL